MADYNKPVPVILKDGDGDRFWKNVDRVEDDDSCWNWIGGKTRTYRRHAVHRVAYALLVENPGTSYLVKKCNSFHCVRPSHHALSPCSIIIPDVRVRKVTYVRWQQYGSDVQVFRRGARYMCCCGNPSLASAIDMISHLKSLHVSVGDCVPQQCFDKLTEDVSDK
jgi:hypothetical protein